ncbi:helix-turn-helix domain-containing protein [Paenibacillus xylanilyticus]|uniref:Helix-turn-helix domain-containing protein n=1 Tax=Paenibacillus xylanilyticus TaxID=248903 RepID=A0A7Y6BV04_9BACL|nr:helix-turn-helix transcriptional regulator [Paenibacillus xylanilyticus]NUU74645.1 helix-turn-helix domain-containing protein [Paenibacillus xylanilyticus]
MAKRNHQSAGELIAAVRKQNGLTITKAAELAGISSSTFSLAEKNSTKHPATYDTLFKIGTALDIDPNTLIQLSPHLEIEKAPKVALITGESNEPNVILARRVKELRKSKNMTQRDVRKIIKMSEIRFSHIELGKYMPDESKLNLLAEVLETSVDYLKGSTDQR